MCIGSTHHKQLLVEATLHQLRHEGVAIYQLDTVDKAVGIELRLELILIRCRLASYRITVHRMVVNDQSTLLASVADSLLGIGIVDFVDILDKERIEVTDRVLLTRNLNARNNQHIEALAILLRLLPRDIQIDHKASIVGRIARHQGVDWLGQSLVVTLGSLQELRLVGAVLHMVGNCDNIHTIVVGLLNSSTRRKMSIGVDGMGMQIGLVDSVAVHFREMQLCSSFCILAKNDLVLVARGLGRAILCRQRKGCDNPHYD